MSNVIRIDFKSKVRLPDVQASTSYAYDALNYVSVGAEDHEYSEELLNAGFTEVILYPFDHIEVEHD